MASALEHYVNNVRTLTTSGNCALFHLNYMCFYFFYAISLFLGSFRELVEYLNDSVDTLSKNSNILDNVLETLDIQQHSLGVLYVLIAKLADSQVILRFLIKFSNNNNL